MFYLRINSLTAFLFISLLTSCFAQTTETIQIDTYYPAPYGRYAELTTTSNTYLATDGGNVGIGTTTPSQKLQVVGNIRVGDDASGYTLPNTDGTANQVLQTDGSGIVTWKNNSLDCITINSGGDWAYCPSGYTVTGCGTYSSSEDDQISGNACTNNEGGVWARCCRL